MLSFRQRKRDPEISRCRTRSVGATLPGTSLEVFYCGLDNADCTYALPIGYDYICKHSDNHAFTIIEDL